MQILSQIACSTVCRSKTCTVSRVPCKRNADLCKFLSVQKFVQTLVNGATVTLYKIKSFDLFSTFYNHQAGFLKTSAETISKVANTEKKKECSHCFFCSRPFFLLALSFSPFLEWFSSLLSAKNLPFSSFSFKWPQVSLKVRFQKTARYISLHKQADFFNCMQCCFGSPSHCKFCIRNIHAKILAKT